MQIAVNTQTVGQFNATAKTLESVTIKNVEYEVFHDFYHLRAVPYRYGMETYKSVGFRIKGKPGSFNFCARAFFARSCKAMNALEAWMEEMTRKYAANHEGGSSNE